MAGDRVVLRSHFNPRDILDSHDAAIGRGADDDLFELLRRSQSALRSDRVRKFLALGRGLPSDPARRVDRVLRLDRSYYLRHGDAELCQLIGFYPQPHRVPAGPKHLNAADSRDTT